MNKNDHIAFYERPADSFEEVFEQTARNVIARMDATGNDIPHQKPQYQIILPSAGVTREQVPVVITDPLNDNSQTRVMCEVIALTEVPALKRGIHMSRIGDCIARLTNQSFESLQEYVIALAEAIQKSQYGGPTHTKVHGVYSYLEKIHGRESGKDKISLEKFGIKASALQNKDHQTQSAGLVITHITACPCVQETLRHASSDDITASSLPLLTHSQRCQTSVSVNNIVNTLPIKKLLEALDRIVFRTRSTLPREYEALLVYGAHRRPQFIEDIVRSVIVACCKLFKDQFPNSSLHVSSVSQESIHDFDIIAELEMSIQKLKEALE